MRLTPKLLEDGTRIYIIDTVSLSTFRYFYKRYNERAFTQEWGRKRQTHYTVRDIFRTDFPEIYQWLVDNNVGTTYWIDQAIHDQRSESMIIHLDENNQVIPRYGFDYGIGFLSDDPAETAFLLRWS